MGLKNSLDVKKTPLGYPTEVKKVNEVQYCEPFDFYKFFKEWASSKV